jgi:hypothetical protein
MFMQIITEQRFFWLFWIYDLVHGTHTWYLQAGCSTAARECLCKSLLSSAFSGFLWIYDRVVTRFFTVTIYWRTNFTLSQNELVIEVTGGTKILATK